MRVRVDHEICEANGTCEQFAPEVFHLREDDILTILEPRPGEALHDKVREAVERCPKVALTILED